MIGFKKDIPKSDIKTQKGESISGGSALLNLNPDVDKYRPAIFSCLFQFWSQCDCRLQIQKSLLTMERIEADATPAEEWSQSLNATCNRLSTQYLNLLRAASSVSLLEEGRHDPRGT
jgi:hypothetical protein